MKTITVFVERLPLPTGCVALGMIGIAALLDSYNPILFYVFGSLSVLFQAALLLKLLLTNALRHALSDYSSLSMLAGMTMALMLTAAQVKSHFAFWGAAIIWYAALLLHVLIIIVFSRKILLERPDLSVIRGNWMLVYVGIAAATVSAPVFSINTIGLIFLIPSAAGAVILLPLVYYYSCRLKNVPIEQRPLFCITAAPVSIWLTGYINASKSPSHILVLVLILIAQILYVPALIQCIRTIRNTFYPSIASYTFPFVISANAVGQSISIANLPDVFWLAFIIETLIAALLCIYTCGRYLCFMFSIKV